MSTRFIPTKVTVNNRDVLNLGKDFMFASLKGVEKAIKEWHEKVLPLHFTMAGFKKYKYKERVLGYKVLDRKKPEEASKQARYAYRRGIVTKEEPVYEDPGFIEIAGRKLFGRAGVKHRLLGVPFKVLQRTGKLKRDVLGPYRLSTGKSDVKAIMNAPKHAYQYRKDFKSPDKVAEITTVLQDEADRMAEIVEASTAHLMN